MKTLVLLIFSDQSSLNLRCRREIISSILNGPPLPNLSGPPMPMAPKPAPSSRPPRRASTIQHRPTSFDCQLCPNVFKQEGDFVHHLDVVHKILPKRKITSK